MDIEIIELPSLKIGRYKYEFFPGDIEELVDWCDRQATFYEGINSKWSNYSNDGAVGTVYAKASQVVNLRSLSQQLKIALEVEGNEQQAIGLVESIKSVFKSAFEEAGLPPEDSDIGYRLGVEIEKDPLIGLPALYAMCGQIPGRSNNQFLYWWPEMWRGLGIGAVLSMSSAGRLGVDGGKPTEQLQSPANDSQASLGRTRSRAELTLRDVRKSLNEFKQKQVDFERQHEKGLADSEKSQTKLIVDSEKAIDDFKKFVKAEIALKAPVTYWEEKANGHKKLSDRSGIATVLLMMALAFIGYSGASFIKELIGVGKDINYAGLIIAGALVTMSFWALRLVVRIFLSQQHLETDSRERVAMVKTYLALQEAGLAPKDADLTPILTALFRPTNDGIVKDEAMPPVLAEFLTRSRN